LSATDGALDKAVAAKGGWAAMSTPPADNVQYLQQAGVVRDDVENLPPEFAAVAHGLTQDELDVLVSVKKRLDEAERVSGGVTAENFFAP
jgi:hypothetical protein